MMNKKIKILFINPVIRETDKPKHIPYGLAQIIAVVRKQGYDLQVFDANAWRPTDKELCDVLKADKWDVIAIGGLVTSYTYIKKCVTLGKSLYPDCTVIVGGGVISPIPFDIMEFIKEIDVGVIGEGVQTMVAVLDRFASGEQDFAGIEGIVYRQGETVHLNALRPLLADVDLLPFPAFDMFPMDIYFRNSSILMSEESMQAKRRVDVLTGYGCPYRCKYCFHLGLSGELTSDGQTVTADYSRPVLRRHSPDYIIELVKNLRQTYDIDFISFLDENFVVNSKIATGNWLDEFFARWQDEGLTPTCGTSGAEHDSATCQGIHWGTTAHAQIVNPELLKSLHDNGCTYLDFGFESFNDDILKSISKGAKVINNERALKWTLEAGIRPIPNQIIGFPDETIDSIIDNVKAWKKYGIKTKPFFATPYPGSQWFYEFKEEIIRQYGGNLEKFLMKLGDATKLTAVISKNFSAVEILGLRELMVDLDIERIEEYRSIWEKNGSCI